MSNCIKFLLEKFERHLQVKLPNCKSKSEKPRSVFTKDDARYKKENFIIGDYTYGSPQIRVYDKKTCLKIGKFCSISSNVTIILGGEHKTNWISTYPFSELFDDCHDIHGHPSSKGDVIIGNDVWIGYGSTLLSGITVGNGAVVGAGSVVTKSVAPYSVVGGNPAKLIRFRFSDALISRLEQIAWWDWPIEKILVVAPLIMSDKMDEFILISDSEVNIGV